MQLWQFKNWGRGNSVMMMMVYNLSSMQPSTVYTDTELIYYLYNLMKYIQLKITSFAITIHKKNRTILIN